jgi:dihydropyrimidinase
MKLYLTYEGLKLDDYEVLTILALARREGVMVMVHAENDACIRWLTDRLLESRKTALRYHVTAHPAIGEREAAYRAISFAELIETPILIVHVSSAEWSRRSAARKPEACLFMARPVPNIYSCPRRTSIPKT